MKTKFLTLALLSIFSITSVFAQDRTTVTANNSEISDNLDLRAVASIFGDSKDLEDFERRLNNPEVPISNLDLNGDNQVDYLRVIETVEGNAHLIVIQSVLGRDMFQDIATVEVEKDRNNRIQVQVVGNVFMYGNNYIYEPVYSFTPVIYTNFWVSNYRPYWSTWYWGYYPTYYYAWNPWPIFRYRNHVNIFVNVNNTCHYVNYRRSSRAIAMHQTRRANSYEVQYPTRSFSTRNRGVNNRHELTQTRATRSQEFTTDSSVRNTRNNQLSETSYTGTRNGGVRSNTYQSSPRTRENSSTGTREMAINTPRNSTRSSEFSYNTSSTIENPKPRVKNNSSSESSMFSTPRNTPINVITPKMMRRVPEPRRHPRLVNRLTPGSIANAKKIDTSTSNKKLDS